MDICIRETLCSQAIPTEYYQFNIIKFKVPCSCYAVLTLAVFPFYFLASRTV
jgi:hypothetical protein